MFTAVKFAGEMGISYPTIVRWLKRGIVPGAILEETPAGSYWQIPESALTMERPKAGRKPKAESAGEAKPARKAKGKAEAEAEPAGEGEKPRRGRKKGDEVGAPAPARKRTRTGVKTG